MCCFYPITRRAARAPEGGFRRWGSDGAQFVDAIAQPYERLLKRKKKRLRQRSLLRRGDAVDLGLVDDAFAQHAEAPHRVLFAFERLRREFFGFEPVP